MQSQIQENADIFTFVTETGESFVVPKCAMPNSILVDGNIITSEHPVKPESFVKYAKAQLGIIVESIRAITFRGKFFDIRKFLKNERRYHVSNDEGIPHNVFANFNIKDGMISYTYHKNGEKMAEKYINDYLVDLAEYSMATVQYTYENGVIMPGNVKMFETEVIDILKKNNFENVDVDFCMRREYIDFGTLKNRKQQVVYYGYLLEIIRHNETLKTYLSQSIPSKTNSVLVEYGKKYENTATAHYDSQIGSEKGNTFIGSTDILHTNSEIHDSAVIPIMKKTEPKLVGYYHNPDTGILVRVYSNGEIVYDSNTKTAPVGISTRVNNIIIGVTDFVVTLNCAGVIVKIDAADIIFTVTNTPDNGIIIGYLDENGEIIVFRTVSIQTNAKYIEAVKSKIHDITHQNNMECIKI